MSGAGSTQLGPQPRREQRGPGRHPDVTGPNAPTSQVKEHSPGRGGSGGQAALMVPRGCPSRLTCEMAPIGLSRTLGCLVEEMRGGGLEMVGGRGRPGRALSWRPRDSG